jgi:5-methyltetrahydrofolate--homocysteine methyltransferase
MDSRLDTLYQGILDGDDENTPAEVESALAAGVDPAMILNDGMIGAMKEVGQRFEAGDYFIPEMLVSARAMQAGLVVLKPVLLQNNIQAAGKVAIGTVKGDLHDIGKNLVAMMLEGAGFEILDLGTDVAPDKFVAVVQEKSPDIVALSALLTTTMPNMGMTLTALQAARLREKVKVIIGGAPINQAYADQIGADGYAADASRAVSLALALLGK